MFNFFRHLTIFFVLAVPTLGSAQSAPPGLSWIQVQALPTADQALDRVDVFEQRFENVVGYTIGGGWHAVSIGPYDRQTALQLLETLRDAGAIPDDSYVANGREYRQQYWPIDGTLPLPNIMPGDTQRLAQIADADTAAETDQHTQTTPAVQSPDETRDQALTAESQLTKAEKKTLQIALNWAGTYNGAIDGAYGRGTRRAMADWQIQNNFEATGVMTTAQRAQLITAFNAILVSLNLQTTEDTRSGIKVDVPTAFVGDPVYDPPFVRFDAKDQSNVQLILVSQTGDQDRLAALYEVLQTLEIFPQDGPRKLRKNSFSIEGKDQNRHTVGFAKIYNGAIKGAILVWPRNDAERQTRAWQEITNSFAAIDGVLEDAYFLEIGENPIDLVSGLEVRKPRFVQSGFFADKSGKILTAKSDLESCGRIQVVDGEPAQIIASNDYVVALGTEFPMSPVQEPVFRSTALRTPAPILVGGFSHDGLLGAPTITFGRVESLTDVSGNTDRARLKIEVHPSDAGAPVFDRGGAIVGVLLEQPNIAGRIPPKDLNHTILLSQLGGVFTDAKITPQTTDSIADMHPVDLSAIARDTAVIVECWD